jgi:hypothetical protein
MMLVPTCSSSKLLTNAGSTSADTPNYDKYYRIVGTASASSMNPYDPALGTATQSLANDKVPYPHLMNVFQSDSATGASPQFHRIFEFLGVPSPFVGTDTFANPNLTTTHFLPPFNRISSYREPGRMNLNTMFNANCFNGLMAYGSCTTWDKFVHSRRGYGAINQSDILAPNAGCPTEFAHPFRSYGGWDLTPADLRPTGNWNREINSTLFRADPDNADRPLFQSSSTALYSDTNANPYFRYQGLMRLSNLVTTRSNIYAVWITVGYFEVSPAPTGYSASDYPDGYQLGRELNIDTGDIKRHRAFYIIDRTIPVGFKRGEDLNVEKTILINRFIE